MLAIFFAVVNAYDVLGALQDGGLIHKFSLIYRVLALSLFWFLVLSWSASCLALGAATVAILGVAMWFS
jgi:hypothetical protein